MLDTDPSDPVDEMGVIWFNSSGELKMKYNSDGNVYEGVIAS